MKRVLITGGTGFVGANLARRLLAEGCEVHLLVRQGLQVWRIADIQSQLQLHMVDMSEASAVRGFLTSLQPDWVFHLAAHGAYSFQTDRSEMVQTNLIGTMNMVDAFLRAGGGSFIHAGSSSEYGFKDHPPGENEVLEPNSDYAVTKAAATLHCAYAARKSGARIITLRLYSVYGPFEDPRRLMPTLVVKGLSGQLPPLVRSDVVRDFIFVDDACDALVRAASFGEPPLAAVYNVGAGIQTSLREIVDLARTELGITQAPRWASMSDRVWDTSTWVSDATRIAQELGWRPKVTLAAGIHALRRWFEKNPAMLEFYRKRQKCE